MPELLSTKVEPTHGVPDKGSSDQSFLPDNRPSTKKKLALQSGIVQKVVKSAAGGSEDEGSKLSVSMEQDMILLQGQVSMAAKFKGLLGSESTFSQLLKVVNSYQAAKSEEDKIKLKPSIIKLGETWLSKNSERTETTDEQKKASISRIVSALKTPDKKVELGSMTDKVTFSAKVKEAVTGTSSTFQLLEKAYLEFQKEASGNIENFDMVYAMLQKGQAVHALTEEWKKRHLIDGKASEPEKLAIIDGINKHLGLLTIRTNFKNHISAIISGIDVAKLGESTFKAASVQLSMAIGEGVATGSLSQVTIAANELEFDTLRLAYQGKLCPITGVTITDPSVTLKNLKDHYEASAEGELDVELSPKYGLNSLVAKGKVAGTYDFGSSSFKELSVEGGELTLGFLDNLLEVSVNGVDAKDGVLKAEKGSLKVNVEGTEIAGEMTSISYSKAEGISFESASISSSAELEFSDLLKVSKPTLGIKRTTTGWEVTGAGHVEAKADVPFVKLDDLSGDLAITYDLASKSFTKTTVAKGSIKATLFDLFSIEASEIGYADSALTIGTASGKLTKSGFLGQSSPKVTAKGLALSKKEADWASVEVELGNEFKMGDFSFKLPNALLEKKTDYVALHLNDAVATFEKDEFEALGKASFTWNTKDASLIPEITRGELSMNGTKASDFPGDYLPFGWPLSFGFSSIIVPAPVPITAGIELVLAGGLKGFSVEASLVYEKGAFEFRGSLGGPMEVSLALKISAGVGSSLLLYIGGFIEAAALAQGKPHIDLNGKASKKDEGFELAELFLTYGIDANFLAKLAGGFEAKALFFFKKELFRYNFKQWDLGSSSISGSYELLKKSKTSDKPSKLFDTTTGDRTDIPAAQESYDNLEYGPALEKLYGILESAGVNTSMSTIKKIRTEGETNESEVSTDTNIIKKNVKKVLVDLYNTAEDKDLEVRLKHYDDKITRIQNGNESRWFTSQAALLERNVKKRDDVIYKIIQIRDTYATSITIYKNLDDLIKPNAKVTLASVEEKILAYQTKLTQVGHLSEQLQTLKTEMDTFMKLEE